MSQLGIGAALHALTGNADSVAAFRNAIGKRIKNLAIKPEAANDGALVIRFEDGSAIGIADEGRSCCENRYMDTDDDLDYHIGGILVNAEVKQGPSEEIDWGTNETAFLEVTTTKGTFTIATHNEHNGYYGGFAIRAFKVD